MDDIIGPVTWGSGRDSREAASDDDVNLRTSPFAINNRPSTTSNASTLVKAPLQSRVEYLETSVETLSRQLASLKENQHHHCDHLAEFYKDLEAFLEKSCPGPGDALRNAERINPVGANAMTERDTEANCSPHVGDPACDTPPSITTAPAVAEVLTDFKEDIMRQGKQMTDALTEFHQSLLSVREELQTCRNDIDKLCVAQREHHENVERRVAAIEAEWREWNTKASNKPPPDISEATKEELRESVRQRLQADLDRNRKEHLQGFDKRLGKAEKAVYKELDLRFANAVSSAENKAAALLKSHLETCTTRSTATDTALADLRRTVTALDARTDSSDAKFASLEKDVVELRRRGGESPTRGSRTVQHLQREMASVQKEIREVTNQLSQLGRETSLEGAFLEVKDWLLDLEKRAMSRGEMLELVNRFETQFAELHRDLHTVASRAHGDTAAE